MQAYMAQYLFLILLIAETDIIKTDIPFDVLCLNRMFWIFDLRFDGEHLAKPLITRNPILELLRKVDQFLHRFRENVHVEQKRDQIRGIQASVRQKYRTDDNDENSYHRNKRIESSMVLPHIKVTVLFAVEKSFVPDRKFSLFLVLIGKRLHNADAREIILDPGIDLRDLLTIFLKRPLHLLIQHIRIHKHDRYE